MDACPIGCFQELHVAMRGGSSIFCLSNKPNLDFDPRSAGPTGQGGITDFERFRTDGAINKEPTRKRGLDLPR